MSGLPVNLTSYVSTAWLYITFQISCLSAMEARMSTPEANKDSFNFVSADLSSALSVSKAFLTVSFKINAYEVVSTVSTASSCALFKIFNWTAYVEAAIAQIAINLCMSNY